MTRRTRLAASTALVAASTLLAALPAAAEPRQGQVVVHPDDPRWLVRYDRDGDHRPFVLAGPGDPEAFLHLGERLPDGTRAGTEQDEIVRAISGTGANSLYLAVVRSGGDGPPCEDPFVDCDPALGLDEDILDQWDRWLRRLDSRGIVATLFLYDDGVSPFGPGDAVPAAERAFVTALVDRFEERRNLIWVVAEEYSEALTPARARGIAAAIRAADDRDHVVAVHQVPGATFDFADDAEVDQFALQSDVTETSPEAVHTFVQRAYDAADGRYGLNLSEVNPWHEELLAAGDRTTLRRSHWAAAMAGAHVMVLGTWRTAGAPPTEAMLRDLGRLRRFLEHTDFQEMAPSDDLASGATTYAMAGEDRALLYAERPGALGVDGLEGGRYDLTWFDTVTGARVRERGVRLDADEVELERPARLGDEVVVWVRPARRG